MTFRSKVDTWLAIVLVGSAAISVGAAAVVAMSASSAIELVPLAFLIATAVFMLWLLRSTTYTFDESSLHVKSGPFHWRVPLSEIRSAIPTRDPSSSPALSLDRIRIDRGSKMPLLISPEDKDAFFAELLRRRPDLRV